MNNSAGSSAGSAPSLPQPPLGSSKRTTSLSALRAAAQNSARTSPPTTPLTSTRRGTALAERERQKEKSKQQLRTDSATEGVISQSYNQRHSHGLNLANTTKDGVVDNLLFALDNLSRLDLASSDVDTYGADFDTAKYKFSYGDELATSNNRRLARSRGHTQSSSLSTELERQVMADSGSPRSSYARDRRSNSGPGFGVRTTISGGARDAKPANPAKKGSTSQRSPQKEQVTYTDTKSEGRGPATQTNKPAWRRSMSMDQIFADPIIGGSSVLHRGRPVPSIHSKYEVDRDVAPEPTIASGPRQQQNPGATGAVYVSQAPRKSTLRKITTQTDLRSANHEQTPAIPLDIREQASDFVRTSTLRGVPPRPPGSSLHSAQPSPTMPNLLLNSNKALPPIQDRPGFFKRVFGTGATRSGPVVIDRTNATERNNTADHPARASSSMGSHARTATRQSSKEQPRDTAAPPPRPLNKKPSSFFRRRKKSISAPDDPPTLPLNIGGTRVAAGEPSPGLRGAMTAFLGEDEQRAATAPEEKEAETSSPRPATQSSSANGSDNLDMFHKGYANTPDASLSRRTASVSPHKPAPSMLKEESPKTKLKVKKRKPDLVVPIEEKSQVVEEDAVPSTGAPVSPLTPQIPHEDAKVDTPTSSASTGDRIIASTRNVDSAKAKSSIRKISIVSTVESDANNGSGVRGSTDWAEPKKSDARISKPSKNAELSQEARLNASEEHSRNASLSQSATARLPASQVATAAAFSSPVQSSGTPGTLYHSTTSVPLPSVQVEGHEHLQGAEDDVQSSPVDMVNVAEQYHERARKIFDGDEEDVTSAEAASWLGEYNTLSRRTLEAFMKLFDFGGCNILAALRMLCGRLVLRGETQQFDRIITALSLRWCECNASHGFKAQDVVHTILYSLILLNTDLHMADIGEKMSRSAYVKNTLPTIKRVAIDATPNEFEANLKATTSQSRPSVPWSPSTGLLPQSPSASTDIKLAGENTASEHERPQLTKRLSLHPTMDHKDSDEPAVIADTSSDALISQPWTGSIRNWELELESILKSFFNSIKSEPLALLSTPPRALTPTDRGLTVASTTAIKRTNSVVSRAGSEHASYRSKPGLRTITASFHNRYTRSRPRLYPPSALSSSNTSFDDGNSVWSPAQSSKHSFGRTLTSTSMQSLGQHFSPRADSKSSIGFANALSQAMIREEHADSDSVSMTLLGGLLDDEALTLEGAPWAKEGLVKHKHHLEALGKKARERSWNECFAVISKGKMTLFAFNTSTKSQSLGRKALNNKSQQQQNGGARLANGTAPKVGGGDWMENAEQLEVFVLRQTIASTLPPPGYSKTRPHVWALSLPSGAVHLFQAGTQAIAQEFMTTANYWSARLSKEPLAGGVSNVEYGWSEQVINTALLEPPSQNTTTALPFSMQNKSHVRATSGSSIGASPAAVAANGPRPSVASSLRGSLDAGFGSARAKLPGDKAQLAEWQPPSQSMMASQLMEVDQLKALSSYVSHVETELTRHNELKHAIELAYSPRHANYTRALENWQRKSEYLLRENVKFQTYADSLSAAQTAREEFYARKTKHEGVQAEPAAIEG